MDLSTRLIINRQKNQDRKCRVLSPLSGKPAVGANGCAQVRLGLCPELDARRCLRPAARTAREVRNESAPLLGLIDPGARGHCEPMLLRACYARSIGKN